MDELAFIFKPLGQRMASAGMRSIKVLNSYVKLASMIVLVNLDVAPGLGSPVMLLTTRISVHVSVCECKELLIES